LSALGDAAERDLRIVEAVAEAGEIGEEG
jgi:hypothetical protein